MSYAFNAGHTKQEGIIPNSGLTRLNLKAQLEAKLNNRITVGGNFNYINTEQTGVPQGNNASSTYFILYSVPRSYNLQGPYLDSLGNQKFYAPTLDHPRWAAENNLFNSRVNRSIGIFTFGYRPTDWLNFTYRAGVDTWTDGRRQVYAIGAASFPTGRIVRQDLTFTRFNHDLLGTVNKSFMEKQLSLTFIAGLNVRDEENTSFSSIGSNLNVPNFYDISNASTANENENRTKERYIGLYGDLNVGFRDYLFLGVSARNDWSSTFNLDNNSFFYPAVNASFIFSDALPFLKDRKGITFGKLRGSYGSLGRAAIPYLLQTAYIQGNFGENTRAVQFPFNGANGFGLSNTAGNANLKPEIQTEWQVGLEMSFLSNRLGFDVSYYNRNINNQIFYFAGVAPSTGYSSARVNGGKLQTTGVDLILRGTPIQTTSFTWDINANFTHYDTRVLALYGENKNFQLGTNRFGGAGGYVIPGQPYGVIVTQKFARDPATNKFLINPRTGLPFATGPADEVVGNPNPKYFVNLFNNFRYKNFRLGFQIDYRKGGDIYTNTLGFATVLGTLEETAVNRDKPRIIDGVLATDESGTASAGLPNNIQITAQDYWRAFSGGFNEFSVFDASYIRLREVSFGYAFPTTIFGGSPVKALDLSVSARNLWTYAPNLRHLDPEISSVGPGNANHSIGFDFGAAPMLTNYGINLRATF